MCKVYLKPLDQASLIDESDVCFGLGESIRASPVHMRRDRVLYWTNRRSPNRCKSCLLTFAGKLDFGCVGAMSAIDLSILSSTGVARKACVSPVCGPLSTVAIPTICPRSLIWLAMVGKRLDSSGNSL